LSEAAQRRLSGFLADLKGFGPVEGLTLYVVGLAAEEADPQQQWLLSAQRAEAAAEFLRNGLPAGTPSRVFSWGAAAGGDWVKQDSPISAQAQIAIAILRPND